ncbi:MAG TPA: hypothetical protein VFT59_01295, partial [Candidatus Saccharimonadales bacterium]|nr:hypothetical protein [Candidatus Saccharimonadales bacterium]
RICSICWVKLRHVALGHTSYLSVMVVQLLPVRTQRLRRQQIRFVELKSLLRTSGYRQRWCRAVLI